MSNIFNANFISMWIRVGTPLIFAALGASICTQAGVVNLGLEGIMLISALMGVLGSVWGGSLISGAIIGILSGTLVSVIFAYFFMFITHLPARHFLLWFIAQYGSMALSKQLQ